MAEIYSSSGSKLRLMVMWHGVEGSTRPEPKQWHGIKFEQGKPTSVEHLPELSWQSMIADIDRSRGGWSYEYVVEAPPEPEPEPEPPADIESDAAEGSTVYRSRPAVKKMHKVRRRR